MDEIKSKLQRTFDVLKTDLPKNTQLVVQDPQNSKMWGGCIPFTIATGNAQQGQDIHDAPGISYIDALVCNDAIVMEDIEIHASIRNRGLGRKYVKAIYTIASTFQKTKVVADFTYNDTFWKHLGFVPDPASQTGSRWIKML